MFRNVRVDHQLVFGKCRVIVQDAPTDSCGTPCHQVTKRAKCSKYSFKLTGKYIYLEYGFKRFKLLNFFKKCLVNLHSVVN